MRARSSTMRSMHSKQLAACMRGYGACGTERYSWCALLVTLCRFDSISLGEAKTGPFIPCERRLDYMGILEIHGRDFWTGFENREHARPHEHI